MLQVVELSPGLRNAALDDSAKKGGTLSMQGGIMSRLSGT